jgi:GAF domain-containing protein
MTGLEPPLDDRSLGVRLSPLLSAQTVVAALQELTALAVRSIDAATGAGVSLIDERGRRTSTGATSESVLAADDAQYRLDQGPCLTAWAERRAVRVDDTATDRRWPAWAAAAHGLDVVSVLSTPLLAGGRVLGAVKVYSAERSAFDAGTEELVRAFADTAALLLDAVGSLDNERRLSAALQEAMRERDTVLLARGILMQRDGLSEEAAAAWLVKEATASGRPLPLVAAAVVETAGAPRHG